MTPCTRSHMFGHRLAHVMMCADSQDSIRSCTSAFNFIVKDEVHDRQAKMQTWRGWGCNWHAACSSAAMAGYRICRGNSALLVRHALVCRMSLGSCTCTAQRCRTALQSGPSRRLSSCGQAATCDMSNIWAVRAHTPSWCKQQCTAPVWIFAALHLTGPLASRPLLQWRRDRKR